MILSHRENFDVNEDTIKHLCEILINNPDGKILSRYFEVLKDTEFRHFAKLLSDKTVMIKKIYYLNEINCRFNKLQSIILFTHY